MNYKSLNRYDIIVSPKQVVFHKHFQCINVTLTLRSALTIKRKVKVDDLFARNVLV